jgi:glucokinase
MVWEAIASGKKTRLSMDSREDPLSGESVYQAARKGDRLARVVFQRMGSNLGLGIANLINLLNPEMVVLGGGLSAAWKFFIPALRLELKKRAFAASAKEVRIVRATAGEDAGILGAAYIVWHGLGVIR